MRTVRAIGLLLICAGAGCASAPTASDARRLGRRGETEGLFDIWARTERDAVRVAVLQAFAANPDDAGGRRLVLGAARAHPSQPVRLAAIGALRAYGGPDVVRALISALADPWPEARDLGRDVLAEKGAPAHAALLEAVDGHDHHLVRAQAARLLTSAAFTHAGLRPAVEDALVRRAEADGAATVREQAAKGLGRLRVQRARGLLSDLYRTDADPKVRLAAAEAKKMLGDRTEEDAVVVAVLPLKEDLGGDAAAEGLGRQVADYVAARLTASEVCRVVDRAKTRAAIEELKKHGRALYDGDTPSAPDIGHFRMANQLVYGSVQARGGRYTLVLNRMNVSTLELVSGSSATVSGYRADLDAMKVELVKRFIAKFR